MSSFVFYPEITDSDFYQKIYEKKEFRDTESKEKPSYDDIESFRKRKFTLSPYQVFLKNYISPETPYNGILLFHSTGTGKCLEKGTKILMYDGHVKKVEDLVCGDLLMGDDSTPRRILSLARGRDALYKVTQENGDSYVGNSEHILCLKRKGDENNVIEIPIKNYFKLPQKEKDTLHGYKVAIDFPYCPVDEWTFDIHKPLPMCWRATSKEMRLCAFAKYVDAYGFVYSKGIVFYLDEDTSLYESILFLTRSVGLTATCLKDRFSEIGTARMILKVLGFSSENLTLLRKYSKNNGVLTILQEKKECTLETPIFVTFDREDEYYGFTLDGNGRFLFPDMTVTHNTCSSLSIAEGFKRTLRKMGKKILIISTLQSNFKNELYNLHKELKKKNPEDNVQCTGKEYELGHDKDYLTIKQKEWELLKIKKSFYQFIGYRKFSNFIIENTGGWTGDEKEINDKIKKFISKEFDNRVIIIDEIQNIKTDKKEAKKIQNILDAIITHGKNIKLILMSATPMFDRPDEIIFFINLLLQNDGRPKINKNDIFDKKTGNLKHGAEDILRSVFQGYVSYVRGEKPFIYPFRIYPKEAVIPRPKFYMSGKKIEPARQIKFTHIVECPMTGVQYNTYYHSLYKKIKDGKILEEMDNDVESSASEGNEEEEKGDESSARKKDIGILFDLTKISNIVYPISSIADSNKSNDGPTMGSYSKYSIDLEYDNGMGGYYRSVNKGKTKKITYKYQSHAIFDKNVPFADEKHLSHYSTKFATILETIKKSKGLIFIFSRFIEQGALPLALVLEQNGFNRYCVEGEEQLLDFPYSKEGGKRRQICYCCGKELNKNNEHFNEKMEGYHVFKIAKYVLFFGEVKDIIKIKKDYALSKFNSDKNKYGEEIKVFIGTKTISEGLDFKRLRQVHIIDPWYNLSRNEQIIGRAIRTNSHIDLEPTEQNVEIYQYASVLKKGRDKLTEYESVDLKNYRISENKDVIIKKISRIMKESAVDCVLFKKDNVVDSPKKVKQISSSGETYILPIADKPYSALCDYNKNCNYTCNWSPNPRITYPINKDTYNIKFASTTIQQIKADIKNMFRENIVYNLMAIEKKIMSMPIYKSVDNAFIYVALEELVGNKNEMVYDKFSRKGYIIYRGEYYIFEPFDIIRDELPILYRENPVDEKEKQIDLETVQLDYVENKSSSVSKEDSSKQANSSLSVRKFMGDIREVYKTYEDIVIKTKEPDKKAYIMSIIGYLYDKMEAREEVEFIGGILQLYHNGSEKEDVYYLDSILHYLDKMKILIDYYLEIEYDKKKAHKKTYVGFIVMNQLYILESVQKKKEVSALFKNMHFVEASRELLAKVKSYRSFMKKNVNKKKKYDKIYGIIDFDMKKNTKIFKIVDKSEEEMYLIKDKEPSKRSIIKGRVCSTFKINYLSDLRRKIGMYEYKFKRSIISICVEIELYFRYLQEKEGNEGKTYFEHTGFRWDF